MIILLPAAILLLCALVLLVLRFFAPDSRYSWLIAALGSLLGLISVFVWQAPISLAHEFSIWPSTSVFSQSPTFNADGIAWPFAVSLLVLNAAIIITAVVRSSLPIPFSFVGTLVLTSLGVLAVSADNPLTLVMIWAAIDLVELITQLRFVEDPKLSERVVIAFASRAAGILILLWADMTSAANGQVLDFHNAATVNSQAGLYLLIAAALRLGVLPLHLPYPGESSIRRGFGTGLRMVSAASSLVLLARIPSGSIASQFTPYLLIFVSFAGIYGSWMWLRAPDELTGRPHWLIGMGSLAVAAALRGNPTGAAAWACALILAGGALFLSSEQNKWIARALPAVGAWGISSLPFSLTATGWISGGENFTLALPLLLVAHAMLIVGYIRQSQRAATRPIAEDQPLWARNVYPIGIFLLLLTNILLSVFGWEGTLSFGNWLAGLIASLLAVGLIWLTPRSRILTPVRAHWVSPAAAPWLEWSSQFLRGLYRLFGRLSGIFTAMLEGEGGIMWTLLFLALFISFFAQGSP